MSPTAAMLQVGRPESLPTSRKASSRDPKPGTSPVRGVISGSIGPDDRLDPRPDDPFEACLGLRTAGQRTLACRIEVTMAEQICEFGCDKFS